MHGDPSLARVARGAVVICLLGALGAGVVWGMAAAAAVLGGGLLMGISYVTLGSGVSALAAGASGRAPERRIAVKTLSKIVVRYALLGFLAYVMIARLRLHPIGLLAGATSITAAAFIEAVRLHTKKEF